MVSVYLEAFPSEDQVLVSAYPAEVSEYPLSAPVSAYPAEVSSYPVAV